MATHPTPLPSPRVVTTTHTASGTSTIASDQPAVSFTPFGPSGSRFHTFHATPSVPASNTTPLTPLDSSLPRAPPAGAIFCTTDIAPGGAAPMHRTLSLDYCCVLEGEITLVVEEGGKDGGKEVKVGKGGIVVQRGAMHAWRNEGEGWCRILVVGVASEKVKVEEGGEELGEYFPKRPAQ